MFGSLRDVLKGLLGDASASLNVFGFEDPRNADLLGSRGLFIDRTVGFDLGYADVIVIQAPSDRQDRLAALTREYERGIAAYARHVGGISSVASFNERMASVLNLGPDVSRARGPWRG